MTNAWAEAKVAAAGRYGWEMLPSIDRVLIAEAGRPACAAKSCEISGQHRRFDAIRPGRPRSYAAPVSSMAEQIFQR